ncbi:MAG: Divergent AAA domain protein [Bacteroidetes bacterium ADurb.BinA012]|nr:MAG: Divergent AAA domain protein [Bacteroidetes bacterium ADurb.BinA012]
MGRYIHNLISGGEGLSLDFKYCISDPQKIARTLSAFSNTAGGKLLIGVRDNGSLAGVRSDEEYYMIDAAARLHCDPEVTIRTRNHTINGKNILEAEVLKSPVIPVKARDEHGRWRAYFRQNDQNFMADRVILQVWRRSAKSRGLLLRFEETENLLLSFLRSEGRITVKEFRILAGINARRAEKILSDFILCGLITYEGSEKGIFYRLSNFSPDQTR